MNPANRMAVIGGALAAALLLAGCAQAISVSESGAAAQPQVQPAQSPDEVAAAFLNAWNAQDLDTMYSLISPQSRELYADEVFKSRYTVVNQDIGFNSVTPTIRQVSTQGTTAIVNYDAKIESAYYGTIDDPGRTMRLLQTPEGWRIAWTTMDIFEGLVGGARITVDSRFPTRGNIYDRDGNLLVEQDGTMVALYSAQQNMSNVDNCIDLLATLMRRQRSHLVTWFANYVPETIFYLGEVDLDTYTEWQGQLNSTCGLTRALPRKTRAYYGNGALAHVTGYVGQVPADALDEWRAKGYREGDLIGLYGIENTYQDVLAGRPERFIRITEPGGTTLRELGNTSSSPSASITLTIRRDLQLAVMKAIYDAYVYAGGNWGGISTGAAAVVLDVNSGAILALVSYPTFNPTVFNPDTYEEDTALIANLTTDPRKPLVDKATQEQYSPGSTFKIITTAAAANEGLIGPEEPFFCDLEWHGGEKYGDVMNVRYDWRHTDGFQAAGNITISQALTASCDPFFYEMGARLFQKGPTLVVDYAERMGMGSKIGLPLPEAQGNLATPSTMGDAINNAVGQGDVQVPPIQMAQMAAAIANGGTLYRAYLVERIGGMNDAEVTFQAQPDIIRELDFRPGVIDIVQKGMCAVPTDENLGTAYLIFGEKKPPYTSCGKTGTAQAGQYPNAWYVAYAPAEKPEIAVVVVVLASREGSEVAAPIVRRIFDYYFNAPVEDYPIWWFEDPYKPLEIPAGGTAGG